VQPAAVAPPVGEGSGSRSGRPGRARLPQAAQLLNAIEDRELERLLDDDFYLAQQKLDGMRVLSHLGDQVVATNRKGEVIALDGRLQEALAALPAGTILDGEVVEGKGGPTYWLFDLLQAEGEDLRRRGYHERYGRLQGLELGGPLRLVATARDAAQKRELLDRLRAEHAEGIVFKRDDAPYTPGRPASGGAQLKYKFIKTADVFITANAGNAYQMAVYDGDRVHEAGRVFAGTSNETRRQLDELLAAGETPVAEVRYLYATDDDILYQPVFVQLRDDKDPADCSISQLVRTSRTAVEPAPRSSKSATKGKGAGEAKPKATAAPAPRAGKKSAAKAKPKRR
jgi:bifunctional non-homologous end joining protein LigD